ncbi:MAG: type II secretion system F family protein [Methylococcales bacterium]
MALELNTIRQVGKPKQSVSLGSAASKKIPNNERMFFIEQLAMMLETGSDLHTSLSVLARQTEHQALKSVLNSVSDAVSEGKTFSAALAEHPEAFSTTYISLIAASESGGYIRRILEHLLQMEKQKAALTSTLWAAVSYPAFLLIFSFAMVVFILAVVFPKFGDLFSSIQDQLPVTTIILMQISNLITQYWWLLLPGLVGFIGICIVWLRSINGQQMTDHLKLHAPILKNIFIKIYLIQSMRILSLSLKNGVNLVEALNLAKSAVKNRGFRNFIDALLHDVTEGRTLAYGFNKVTFIPPMVQQMISTGEATGNLAMVSERIADYFQQDLEKLLKLVTKAIEPIMLLVMGVVVGVLVSSLILPIFKLSHAVH